VLPLLCYAYIVFYGLSGSKVRAGAAAPATEAST
jgi:FHS family L-fucose permease-like MFS transporter